MFVFNEMLYKQVFRSSSLAVLMVSLNSSEQLLVLPVCGFKEECLAREAFVS